MMKYFFAVGENMPKGMGFSLYDKYHINWLCIITLFIFIMAIKYKKMAPDKRQRFIKIFGSIILFTEIYYQSVVIITRQYNINCLPLHLCGLAVFICFFDAFWPNEVTREFLYCLCMPGALMALLFPNWGETPILNFASINSFIVHSLLIAYPVMLIYSGEFMPDYKRLPKCGLYLVFLATPIYFFNKIFDTNFLFINEPSEGSPLIIFENWFGNPGYIFGIILMMIMVWSILYIPILIKNLHIKKNKDLIKAQL